MLAVKPQSSFHLSSLFACLNNVDRIALAVSGGSDSLAMMYLVAGWARLQALQPSVFVLSVDHSLRVEAAQECAQVAIWASELGMPHVTLKWEGAKPDTGIQAEARNARYDLMAKWCAAHNVAVLLTAHTLDDQAETVVMRQSRTSSAKSLAAIWPERDWQGIKILRPLLGTRREELRDLLLERGQNWIDDPSNRNLKFERVRVRMGLNGDNAAAKVAVRAQEQVRGDWLLAQNWFDARVSVADTGLVTFDPGEFSELEIRAHDDVLIEIFRLNGMVLLPDRHKRTMLVNWLASDVVGRRTLGGLVFVKRAKQILVAREPGRILREASPIGATGMVIWDGRFRVEGQMGAEVMAAGQFGNIQRRKDLPAFVNAGLPVVCLNKALISAPFHGFGGGFGAKFIGSELHSRTWN